MRMKRETITSKTHQMITPNQDHNRFFPQGCGYPPATDCDKFAEKFAINVTIVSFLFVTSVFTIMSLFNLFHHLELGAALQKCIFPHLNQKLPNDHIFQFAK